MALTAQSESRARLEILKELLQKGASSTQEEICEALKSRKFDVTQSTVSRDLRRLGAVKVIMKSGETSYKLPNTGILEPQLTLPMEISSGLKGLLKDIQHNGSLIVIHTPPGSASMVAHHLDSVKPRGILGTIAGDDTIFVAPFSSKEIEATMREIINELS